MPSCHANYGNCRQHCRSWRLCRYFSLRRVPESVYKLLGMAIKSSFHYESCELPLYDFRDAVRNWKRRGLRARGFAFVEPKDREASL